MTIQEITLLWMVRSTFFQLFSLLICETACFNLLRSAKWRHYAWRHFTLTWTRLPNVLIFIPPTLLASFSSLRTLVQNLRKSQNYPPTSDTKVQKHFWTNLIILIQNGDDIWPKLRRSIIKFIKVRATKTWKELTTGVQQLLRLLFDNNSINPGLVL